MDGWEVNMLMCRNYSIWGFPTDVNRFLKERRREVYERYAKLRTEKGVSDAEVARNAGVDKTTLSHWKKGDYTPKVESIIKIADYFDVSLDYFYRERWTKKA